MTRRRRARFAVGSNQHQTRPAVAASTASIARWTNAHTGEPDTFGAGIDPHATLDDLNRQAVDHYKTVLRAHGEDPEAELTAVRFGGVCPIETWVGWRLVCDRYGLDPNDPGPHPDLRYWIALRCDDHGVDMGDDPELAALTLVHADWATRRALAENERTSPVVLAVLAHDPEDEVREEVARNRITPPGTLDLLARQRPALALKVIRNPSVARETLEWLAGHEREDVRRFVAHHHPEVVGER